MACPRWLLKKVLAGTASCSLLFFAFQIISLRFQPRLISAELPELFCGVFATMHGCWCSLFKPLMPLWGRQIPYTMMKFAAFENVVNALYANVVPKPKAECSKTEQLGVSFAAGYIAGTQLLPAPAPHVCI